MSCPCDSCCVVIWIVCGGSSALDAPLSVMGEKKKSAQEEMVVGFFDISRAHFHSPVRREVAIRVPRGDPSCLPCSTVQCTERKTQLSAFYLHCERTVEQLDYRIGCVQSVLVHTCSQRHQCAQTRRRLWDACNADSDC